MQHGSHNLRGRPYLILLVLVAGAICGVLAGGWLANRGSQDEMRRMDETLGLGKRTGLQGDLILRTGASNVTVRPGGPIAIDLTLTNQGEKRAVINGWLAPIPADFDNNQFPVKAVVTEAGRKVEYLGNGIILPPHKKKDFITLGPGESKTFTVDLSRGAGGGAWKIAATGTCRVELWYETYLTGRYSGVDAWTGMTNHVAVQVRRAP
ncbi:MAG: hypothetical protein ACYC2Y_02915 [Armatimonadota bacterium]